MERVFNGYLPNTLIFTPKLATLMHTDPNPKPAEPTPPAQGIPSEKPPVETGGGNQQQLGGSNEGIGTGEYESDEPQWDAEKNTEYDQ